MEAREACLAWRVLLPDIGESGGPSAPTPSQTQDRQAASLHSGLGSGKLRSDVRCAAAIARPKSVILRLKPR